MSTAKLAFKLQTVRLALEDILPARLVSEAQKRIGRYDTIVSSIRVAGLVEPLVVHPQKGQAGKYLLVNGHMRLLALKELGETHADCLIASDDECFTYNARVSRLPAIQEHKMITRAVKDGASLERIAEALNISSKLVYASLNLLKGINDEAVEMLKDKPISPKALRMLTKVNGDRQVDIARLMNEANNYHASYVEGLVLGTRKDQLANPNSMKKKKGMSVEAIAKMEQELEQLESGMNAISETYRENMFTLQTAQTYIKSLLNNSRVAKYLVSRHAEINTEFQNIAAADSV